VKEFKYLGIVLSPQLSYSNHIDYCVTKAKSRIAYLYLTIPIYEMPLEIVVQIFQVYLLPIFTYCSAIWSYNVNSQNAIQKLNAVFTNYMKRYFGIPKYAHNAAIHFYSGTWPLYNAIKHSASQSIPKINFPENSMNDSTTNCLLQIPNQYRHWFLNQKWTRLSKTNRSHFEKPNI